MTAHINENRNINIPIDPEYESEPEQDRGPPMYVCLIRNKFICTDSHEDIQDFINTYKHMMDMMENWKADGIKLRDDGGVGDDYAWFYTYDEAIAERYGFELDELLFDEE